MARFRRFLKLERPRGDGGAPVAPRVSARFAAEPDEAAREPPPPEVDRFAPPPDPAADLGGDPDDDERPHVRCLACAGENGRYAAACRLCGADLRTRAVVRLNRRLWQEERRARDADREARRVAQAAEIDALTEQRRELKARAAVDVDRAFHRILAEHRSSRRTPLGRIVALLWRLLRLLGRPARRRW